MDKQAKIQKLIKEGYKPKQAVAIAISMARKHKKMAQGGYVEGSDGDLDQEHERNLTELMIQGDQPPIANPEEMDAEMALAKNLHAESEKEEYYAMGGLVEPDDGDETPEPHNDGLEDDYKSDKAAKMGHSEIDGVPRIAPSPLSKEAMEAITAKKKSRRFMK